jgi:D-3-phosphoglycerate dehydrogenase / 2-oxoglutarate reductase
VHVAAPKGVVLLWCQYLHHTVFNAEPVMPRILVTPSHLIDQPGPYRDILEKAGLEVVYPPKGMPLVEAKVVIPYLDGVSGVLAGTDPLNREMLEAATDMRGIARHGVGYDSVDVAAATELDIVVAITPGTNEHSAAEHMLSLLLAVSRGYGYRLKEMLTGAWTRQSLPRLAGRTLGLVGLGRIAKAVVPRAQGLQLTVIAYDPFADQEFAKKNNVRLVGLDELLATADVVSLHLPCTEETREMINAKSLAKMKRGAILINTSRGGLVDEKALFDALSSRHLAGAGLDVYQIEPLPLDSTLLKLDNVVLTPHMAGIDDESLLAMSTMAAQCLADLYQGRWPPEGCVVNSQLREGWRWDAPRRDK